MTEQNNADEQNGDASADEARKQKIRSLIIAAGDKLSDECDKLISKGIPKGVIGHAATLIGVDSMLAVGVSRELILKLINNTIDAREAFDEAQRAAAVASDNGAFAMSAKAESE